MLKFIRCLIVVLACFVMWLTPNSGIEFFRSLIILSMGYTYDYSSILVAGKAKNDLYDISLGAVGTMYSLLFVAIGFAGLANLIVIDLETSPFMMTNSALLLMEFSCSLDCVLTALMFFPFLSGLEFFVEAFQIVAKIRTERRRSK